MLALVRVHEGREDGLATASLDESAHHRTERMISREGRQFPFAVGTVIAWEQAVRSAVETQIEWWHETAQTCVVLGGVEPTQDLKD